MRGRCVNARAAPSEEGEDRSWKSRASVEPVGLRHPQGSRPSLGLTFGALGRATSLKGGISSRQRTAPVDLDRPTRCIRARLGNDRGHWDSVLADTRLMERLSARAMRLERVEAQAFRH